MEFSRQVYTQREFRQEANKFLDEHCIRTDSSSGFEHIPCGGGKVMIAHVSTIRADSEGNLDPNGVAGPMMRVPYCTSCNTPDILKEQNTKFLFEGAEVPSYDPSERMFTTLIGIMPDPA